MTFSILIHVSKLFLISLANWVDWRQQKTQTVVGFWSWRVIESHSNLANVPFHWHHLCFYSCCNFVFINKRLELSPAITRFLIGWKRVLYESFESIKNGAKTVTLSANSLFWNLENNAWGIKDSLSRNKYITKPWLSSFRLRLVLTPTLLSYSSCFRRESVTTEQSTAVKGRLIC